MGLVERREKYAAIEQRRGRPLIVYATSTRHNVQAMMAADAVREFIDQLDAIPAAQRKVDVMIHSAGGDALTAWKLMSLMRERFDDIGVLVPSMAFSAATMFSLGANEIVMHPHASLGPIDPQITANSNGQNRQFSYEEVGAFLRFLKKEVGLTDQRHIATIVEKLLSTIDPLSVGFAHRASELSTDIGERLLKLHMTRPAEHTRNPRSIAELLNKSFFAHGDAVSRRHATELGLNVLAPDAELEGLVWGAFLEIEETMRLREPFNALEIFMADKDAAAQLQTPAALQLPPNTPEPMVNSAWSVILNTAVQRSQTQSSPEVPYEIVLAIVESRNLVRRCVQRGTVSVTRLGQDLKVGVLSTQSGWESVQMSSDGTASGNVSI